MSEKMISVFELLNLAIGTPQRGAVNFSALHALLHAVLLQLDVRETRWERDGPGVGGKEEPRPPGHRNVAPGEQGPQKPGASGSSSTRTREDGERQNIQDLNKPRDNLKEDMKEAIKEEIKEAMKKEMKEEIKEEIKEAMKKEMKEDMKEEIKEDVKEEIKEELKEEMKEDVKEEITEELKDMKEQMKELCQQQQAAAEPAFDVEQCCHRVDALEEVVRSLRDTWQRQPDPEELSRCVTWDAMETTLLNRREQLPEELDHSEVTDAEVTEVTGAVQDASRPAAPGALTSPGLVLMAAGVSERYSETLEALRTLGQLAARVAALERGKADRSQLDQLTEHYANQSSQDASSTLMDQLDAQRDLIDGLLTDRYKLDSLEDMLVSLTRPDTEGRSGAPGSEEPCLRKSVKKLEEDVKQMKVTQALCVERSSDGHLQDQLDDLWAMLEDSMQSLTSQAVLDGSAGGPSLGPGTVNTGRLLHQHYKQLQDTVSGLPPPQSGGQARPPDPENVELADGVQRAILQLQAECEQLHETTRSLTDDSRKRRSHIEELFKTTEELQEKKADKQLVESGIQADKSALDSKVSRLQFDSVTEQLNGMFHELLSRVTGQEQDWSKVIDRLSTEMECKLNRMELDSVKKQLEDRWKNIRQKLQAQGAPEQEDAAGIRKQLVDRFHCLSCDRPVVMHTHGQHLLKLPSSPGFPPHKSIRPVTVYALEQFRQHYRSLNPGASGLSYQVAVRRRQQLQRSHAVMCSQIESMQRTLPGSHTAEDHQGQNQNQNQNQTGILHERVPEGPDSSYLAVPRSCGGSHTVTSAGQRRSGLQPMKHHAQVEGDQGVQSEEVDIIGLDGHIYKGRLNAPARNTETKLPTIYTKDGKTKDKAKCSLPHKPSASPEVYHPHSIKSAQSSRSASSSSGRDWPVSALGSVTPTSAAAESPAEPLDL